MDDAALADLTPDSSTADLQAGEEITVRNLLYCLLLASANEAANALAIVVAGGHPHLRGADEPAGPRTGDERHPLRQPPRPAQR